MHASQWTCFNQQTHLQNHCLAICQNFQKICTQTSQILNFTSTSVVLDRFEDLEDEEERAKETNCTKCKI